MLQVKSLTATLAVAGGLVLTSPADAQLVPGNVYKSITGQQIGQLVRERGYRAEETTDSRGDPLIRTSMSGWNVTIFTYSCDRNAVPRSCESIQFFIGFNKKAEDAVVRKWNLRKRYAKAYAGGPNDNYPLTYDLLVDGISGATFQRAMRNFESLLNDFVTEIGWR